MKKNHNTIACSRGCFARFPDGAIQHVAVDNFPAECPDYLKENGFRRNDISVLDRLSFGLSSDPDLLRMVSARVRQLSESPKSNLSEEQLIRVLKPSWVQTASEIKAYDEAVYQYLNTTQDVTDKDVEAASEASPLANEPGTSVDSTDNTSNETAL